MRKFSQIVESKEELLSRINIDDNNIEEIFIDLVDNGYTLLIDQVYISTSTGYPHRRKNDVKNYYPGIEIGLDREITEESISNGGKGDVRNWDGSIYFESDIDIIDSIYNSIHRVKSMLSNKASVYYSIRSVNHIEIRVIFDKEDNGSPIDYEEIENVIGGLQIEPTRNDTERFRDLDGQSIEGYSISFDSSWRGDLHELKIALRSLPNTDINIFPELSGGGLLPSEWVIKKAISNGKSDNKEQLMSIFNIWVTKFFNKIKSENVKLIPVSGQRKDNGYKIREEIPGQDEVKDLITIFYWYEDIKTQNVVTKKGGFIRRETKNFEIYELYFRVKIENK